MLNATEEQPKQRRLGIEAILTAIAILLTVGMFSRAIVDVDNGYDPGWYHLPFAARIWGILPESMFIGDEKWFEPRFAGFPLLAHFLQGFFWRLTGRMQSTNLVGCLAITGYFFFLRKYLRVPFYLSTIALLTIPLVQAHASSSYVDLLGNVGTSILVMMTYCFYKDSLFPSRQQLFMAFLGAAIAVNTKTQLQPLVVVILLFTGSRLAWLIWRNGIKQPAKIALVTLLASLVIFATPVKNTVLYGNPLYPIKIEIAGIVLNHKLNPDAFEEGNRQINWVTSVLGINAPLIWSAAQWDGNPVLSRRGGFLNGYVVFNLLLLVGFWIRESILNRSLPKSERHNEARLAVLTAIAMSIVPLNFPQSHELRYFMYWMITLVSLNLHLVSLPKNRQLLGGWLRPKYLSLACALFLTIIVVRTEAYFFRPTFISEAEYVDFGVKQSYLDQIEPNEKVCIVARHMGENISEAPVASLKYIFAYSSYFHPEIGYDYLIKTAFDPDSCGDLRIIPNDLPPEAWNVD